MLGEPLEVAIDIASDSAGQWQPPARPPCPQHDAVTKVIGDALAHDTLVASGRYFGQLWLRDAETTAWQILLAKRRLLEAQDDRERFFEAWCNT
ncbi:hypothetical protein ACFY74_33410 [Streptomyces massasporeus]|uniref:hypothetical protein n=1 Tax=Streptomyces massasporeus TaxID=67324 RepID=UPI0036C38978